jgi:hypothetical protein
MGEYMREAVPRLGRVESQRIEMVRIREAHRPRIVLQQPLHLHQRLLLILILSLNIFLKK